MVELIRRFPALRHTLPRVNLRVHESPVEWWTVDGVRILIKRDDVCAPVLGGNKVRALEFLLAGAGPDSRVLTVGSAGSTHALAVALYASRLLASCEVITWPQEENDASRATRRRLSGLARVTPARSVVEAYARAFVRRLRPSLRWIPAGGSSPLGALGHANGMFECLTQLELTGISQPAEIVVPLGSGGTAAGMLVALSVASAPIRLVAARVVPKIVANRRRVIGLARRTHALLAELSGTRLPPVDESLLEIDGSSFGGAYARETEEAGHAARLLRDAGGPVLDGTYSAKALAVTLQRARRATEGHVMFWLTFDGRWMDARPHEGMKV